MLPNGRAQPAAPDKPSWGARLLHAHRRAPTWLKITVIAVAVLFFPVTLGLIILTALVYAVVSVVQGRRTAGASASVAVWGLVVFTALSNGNRSWLYSLLLLPFVVALAVHARPLARWFIPCRTVAWVLLWSVPAGIIALKAAPGQPFLAPVAAPPRRKRSGRAARQSPGRPCPEHAGPDRGAALRRARRARLPGRRPQA